MPRTLGVFFIIMESEIWKDVVGYEGLYQVSNLGRVKSLDRNVIGKDGRNTFFHGKIIKPYLHKTGCLVLNLRNTKIDNKHHLTKVHRIVAQAFIPNPQNLPLINHKDENRTNNNVNNLEWCNHQYNVLYGDGRKKRKETILKRYNGWHHRTPVEQYTLDGKFVARYDYLKDVVEKYNYSSWLIKLCLIGKKKSYNGYLWKPVNK